MKVVISQGRYVPNLMFMKRLNKADLFILYDTCQVNKRDIEVRNQIDVHGVEKYLTLGIETGGREKIINSRLSSFWYLDHINRLKEAYHKNVFYDKRIIEEYYHGLQDVKNLSDFMYHSTINLFRMFNIRTEIVRASKLGLNNNLKGIDDLKQILKNFKPGTYVTGIGAKDYGLKEDSFESINYNVEFDSYYDFYEKYKRDFKTHLCFFDTVFNIGLNEFKNLLHEEY